MGITGDLQLLTKYFYPLKKKKKVIVTFDIKLVETYKGN